MGAPGYSRTRPLPEGAFAMQLTRWRATRSDRASTLLTVSNPANFYWPACRHRRTPDRFEVIVKSCSHSISGADKMSSGQRQRSAFGFHPGRDDRRIQDTQWCRENNAACFLPSTSMRSSCAVIRARTPGAAQRHNGGGDNGPTASLADASERGCGASASSGCAAIGRTASTARCVRDRYVSR